MIPARPWLFWLTLAVVITGGVVAGQTPRNIDQLPDSFEAPVLALELPATVSDLTLVLNGPERRAQLLRATVADLPFIVAYTALWTVMAWQSAPAFAVLPLVGGIADVVEDVAIFAALKSRALSETHVAWTYWAAWVKWLALGSTFVGFALRLTRRVPRDGWDVVRLARDLAYGYGGVLIVVGVFVFHPVIERGLLPLGAALLMQLIVAAFRAPEVAETTRAT